MKALRLVEVAASCFQYLQLKAAETTENRRPNSHIKNRAVNKTSGKYNYSSSSSLLLFEQTLKKVAENY